MTDDIELERVLDAWFAEGPLTAPDRVMHAVADRAARQRQRPAWRLRPWRFPTMSTPLKAILVGAALVALILGGSVLIAGGRGAVTGPVPTPTPTPTATPVPSPATLRETASAAAGTYRLAVQAGTLALTLPDGWSVPQVTQEDFSLHWKSGPTTDDVKVFFDMRRAAKDAACTEGPEPGVGASAIDIAGSLKADPQLDASQPAAITVGGMRGLVVDVSLAASATRTCPFSDGKRSVPLVVDAIPGAGAFWGVGEGGERIRLVILDAGTHNIVVAADSADGTSFNDLVNAVMPVVTSFAFQPG
jgi:hypothetical protein